uniref:Uncharacterized protein n=1 Tax=Acrobeloides nanus TaxID=290746 RepID=A0A914E2B7_9BILA
MKAFNLAALVILFSVVFNQGVLGANFCPAALEEIVLGSISFTGDIVTSGTIADSAFLYRLTDDVYNAAILFNGVIVFNENNLLNVPGALAFNGNVHLDPTTVDLDYTITIQTASVSVVYKGDVYKGPVTLSGTLTNNVNLLLTGSAQVTNTHGQVANEQITLVGTITPPLIPISQIPKCPNVGLNWLSNILGRK